MIVKKPYAFLIKNFRIIHAILFLLLLYIAFKTVDIYSFFNEYATTSYYINSADLATSYINYLLFGSLLISLLLSALIFYILKIKNKPNKFYIILSSYYVVIFLLFLSLFSTFQGLQTSTMDVEEVRLVRDITLLISLPQIVFIFMVLGRSLGFNIRQFDFKRDLEDLEIDVSDYEEVEITLGKNNYKYFRNIRKFIRYTKYFILENKFFVTLISSVIVLALSLTIFLTIKVYSVEYSQNQELLASTLWYTAKDAYITEYDLTGSKILDGKYYILINVKIDNKYDNTMVLSRETFRLKVGSELLFPKFSYVNEFIDVGEVYNPTEIRQGETKNFVVVFEVSKKQLKKEYTLKIKNADKLGFGQITTAYKDVVIKPEYLYNQNENVNYVLPNEISFDKTILGETKLKVTSYEIGSTIKDKYKYCKESCKDNCSEDDCYNGTYVVRPSATGKGELSVLKIVGSIEVDENKYINKFLSKPSDLYKYYATIHYRYQGEVKNVIPKVITTDYGVDTNSYLEVPREVEEANRIYIILTIRGMKYTIVLRG